MQMCYAIARRLAQQGSGSLRSRTWGAWEGADRWGWCSEGRQEGLSAQQRQEDASSQAAIAQPSHSSGPVPSQAQEPGKPLLLAAPPRRAARGLLFLAPHTEKGQEGQATGAGQEGTEGRKTDSWKLQRESRAETDGDKG